MNKRVKWGIIIVIGAGLIGGGIYSQLPKENEELAAADKVMTSQRSGPFFRDIRQNHRDKF